MTSSTIDVRSAVRSLKDALARGAIPASSLEALYAGVSPGTRAPCPLHGGGSPNFEVYPDGGWRCHSRCHQGGDVFTFVAARELGHVLGHPLRGDVFARAVTLTLERLSIDASAYASSAATPPKSGKKKARPYPPADEVARLLAFAHELPATGDVFALGGRARPGIGTCAVVAALSLCVVLGPDTKKHRPKWAERWPEGKLFPLFDARGRLATVQLRPDDPQKGKSQNPAGFSSSAYLMNEPLLALLRGESRDEQNRARLLGYETARDAARSQGVLLTEGVPAWCAWSRWHAGPVGALPGQDPSPEWMRALPRDCAVLLDFDPDLVGYGYLRAALAGLVQHEDVRISRRMRWIVDHAEAAQRDPDGVAYALRLAREADPSLLDPDEIADGPRLDRAGFVPLITEERSEIVGRGEAFGRAWVAALRTNEEGRVLATEGNLIGALKADERWLGVLGYDERTEQVTLLRRPPVPDLQRGEFPRSLGDADASHVGAWYEAELAVEFKNATIHRALLATASLAPFDRIREYLARCAAIWDGRTRIDSWLVEHFGADDAPVVRAIGRKWLISAVARALAPGCKADHVLVLEGAQGVGKSTGLEALCPDRCYFTDALPELRADKSVGEIVTGGYWICEIAELDAIAKSESSSVKAFLTRRDDPFRPAYGRYLIQHPRRVVFCASTNDATYLRDSTGGRRFWPVLVRHVDVAAVAAVRDQLWAEAVLAYRAGEPWHIEDGALLAELAVEQESRREVDIWETPVASYLESYRVQVARARGRGEVVRVQDLPSLVLERLGIDVAKTGRTDGRRVNAVLRTLGWERIQRRDGVRDGAEGARRWAWEPTERWIARGVTSIQGGVTSTKASILVTQDAQENVGFLPYVTSVTSVTRGSRAQESKTSHAEAERDPAKTLQPPPRHQCDAGDAGDEVGGGDAGYSANGDPFTEPDDDAWSPEKCAAEEGAVRW